MFFYTTSIVYMTSKIASTDNKFSAQDKETHKKVLWDQWKQHIGVYVNK